MKLSALQRYILLECLNARAIRIARGNLGKFYVNKKNKPSQLLMTKIITKSIERLINRELMVGFGERTAHKWFIKEIQLTAKGKRETKKLLGEQVKLPLKN